MGRAGAVLGVAVATALLSACGSAAGRSHPSVAGVSTTDGAAPTAGPSATTGAATTTGPATAPTGVPNAAPSATAAGAPPGAAAPATTAPPPPPRSAPAPTTGAPPPAPAPTAAPSIPATTAAPSTTGPPASASLAIRNFSFQPATLRVAPGTVVTVTNDDATTHTWTADGAAWDSGPIAPASSYRHTFTTPGTFSYHCSIHPYMTGTVQVA